MFKELTAEEEKSYRQWARDNYKKNEPVSGVWHPVIQEECSLMNLDNFIPELPTYIFHEDPGHGWLQVTKADIVMLGLEDQISSCSYERRNCVYLEEDSDLSKFWNAYEERFKQPPKLTKKYYDKHCHIRNYDCYTKESL